MKKFSPANCFLRPVFSGDVEDRVRKWITPEGDGNRLPVTICMLTSLVRKWITPEGDGNYHQILHRGEKRR